MYPWALYPLGSLLLETKREQHVPLRIGIGPSEKRSSLNKRNCPGGGPRKAGDGITMTLGQQIAERWRTRISSKTMVLQKKKATTSSGGINQYCLRKRHISRSRAQANSSRSRSDVDPQSETRSVGLLAMGTQLAHLRRSWAQCQISNNRP